MPREGVVLVKVAKPSGFAWPHALQRELGRLLAPLWIWAATFYLLGVRQYRIEELRESRRAFDRIRRENDAPILICANHLTLIDSMLVALALASSWRLSFHFNSMPWNTPERANFAAGLGQRIITYLAKCIPITRGGRREDVADVLNRVVYLTQRGELALVFPEGGRSRSGRVDVDAAAWGVGRVIAAIPECRVVCVYLRGRGQDSFGDLPAKGERFDVEVACIEPKSDFSGARRSRDLSRQVVAKLANMEEHYFDDRQ